MIFCTVYAHPCITSTKHFIRFLQNDATKLYKRLSQLQSDPNQEKHKRVKLFGEKVDLVDHYEKQLEDIEENLRMEQSEVSLDGDVCALLLIYLLSTNL